MAIYTHRHDYSKLAVKLYPSYKLSIFRSQWTRTLPRSLRSFRLFRCRFYWICIKCKNHQCFLVKTINAPGDSKNYCLKCPCYSIWNKENTNRYPFSPVIHFEMPFLCSENILLSIDFGFVSLCSDFNMSKRYTSPTATRLNISKGNSKYGEGGRKKGNLSLPTPPHTHTQNHQPNKYEANKNESIHFL